MSETSSRPDAMTVWMWLISLMIMSVLAKYLPVPYSLSIAVIFTIAFAQVLLAMTCFMNLLYEKWLVRIVIIFPALLFIGMTLTLIPDIVLKRG